MSQRTANSKCSSLRPRKQTQRGVGLIEVLIAVLVLSIGILGLAALQTRALSDNGSSLSRSAATAASYSILEAMRLDRASALNGDYNKTVATNSCPAVGTTLADYQLNNWCSKQLTNFLGTTSSTTGKIECSTAGICTITIQFDDSKATGGSNQQKLITQASI